MNYSSMLLKMVDTSVIASNSGYDKFFFKCKLDASFGTFDKSFITGIGRKRKQ